jgi:ribosomal protein L11 methyltransferase
MPREWRSVEVVVDASVADIVAGDLWAAGAAGIEEFAERGGVMLRATARAERAVAVTSAARLHGQPVVTVVEPEAELDTWRRWAEPVQVGAVVVQPSWVASAPPTDPVTVVAIDPGRTFGSGSHPSTQLALAMLQGKVGDAAEVLDIGCGSGVLAVCSARLGAARVTAVDVDPGAVTVTTSNAARNDVSHRVVASVTPVAGLEPAFDLVVANLTAATLEDLAPFIVPLVAPGGMLIVSGVLVAQIDDVSAAYTALSEAERRTVGDWAAMAYVADPAGGRHPAGGRA